MKYEIISQKKAEKLQQTATHVVEHGNAGECPTCGHAGIYDLKDSGLMPSSIFYSVNHEKWRCMLCDLRSIGY
ncbi:MAG: hypothetical protein WA003_09575 [Desulfuromonadaceae bacterium]